MSLAASLGRAGARRDRGGIAARRDAQKAPQAPPRRPRHAARPHMSVSAESRIVVLPNDHPSFTVVTLPRPSDLTTSFTCLVAGSQLYEVRQLSGHNPRVPGIVLPSNVAVKSWILEPADAATGLVLQLPLLVVASKFNPAYLLISLLHGAESDRYVTCEDVVDTLAARHGAPAWIAHISDTFPAALAAICDTLSENGDIFYRFSHARAVAFLDARVQRLASLLGSAAAADFQIVRHIKSALYLAAETEADIPPLVLEQAIAAHCLELVRLYCLPAVAAAVTRPTDVYTAHLALMEEKRRDLALVEANTPAPTAKPKPKPKPTKPRAAKAAKIPVGKGALDTFFKRA
jgi:ribonuclease H2 subunit B